MIHRDLEARGTPIGQNDLWIAAQARATGDFVTLEEGRASTDAMIAARRRLHGA